MRIITLGVLATSALALGACHPKPMNHSSFGNMSFQDDNGAPLKTVATLDCPSSQGALTRTAQAADGKSCDYQGPGDETVHLSLVALDGEAPADALSPIKTELQALVPAPLAAHNTGAVNVEASKDEGGDRAKVDLPFFHVDAQGDKADVKIFGTTIHANGKTADVHTNLGLKNTVVHAGPGGAEVVAENVGTSNASLVYILAGDSAGPQGYKMAGYIARGPKAGPLVVGEFKAREGRHRTDGDSDVNRLIERNVKG
jgi:hypothetical protein